MTRDVEPQLTLDLFNVSRHDFDSFHAGGNGEALLAVRQWAAAAGPRVIHLKGGTASGKSHLLQAAIKAADGGGARAMYVPLRDVAGYGEQVLADLQRVDVVALDDIDACAADPRWEERLFTLYNDMQAAERRLLWSASVPAAHGGFTLADLASRIDASLIYHLHALADADKAHALRETAGRRGLALPEAVIEFIMRRQRRDMASLMAVLETLDRASLSQRRALTVPFAKEVLGER
jgi:DnaA family protein